MGRQLHAPKYAPVRQKQVRAFLHKLGYRQVHLRVLGIFKYTHVRQTTFEYMQARMY